MGAHDDDYEDYSDDEPAEDDAPTALVPQQRPKVSELMESLGLGRVTTKDKFNVSYSAGTLKATVKRPDGVTQSVLRTVKSGFRSMTEFDPSEMRSKDERNDHIRRLYVKGATQHELAEQFGLSQSMINRIVNER